MSNNKSQQSIIQLNEEQETKAQTLDYILIHISKSRNIDDFIKYLSDFNYQQNFIETLLVLVYSDIEWNMHEIFKTTHNEMFIDIHQMNQLIISITASYINKYYESIFLIACLNKEILTNKNWRILYSKLLIMYAEGLLNQKVCKIYYQTLQSWVNFTMLQVRD
jgi:hypothetical protein